MGFFASGAERFLRRLIWGLVAWGVVAWGVDAELRSFGGGGLGFEFLSIPANENNDK